MSFLVGEPSSFSLKVRLSFPPLNGGCIYYIHSLLVFWFFLFLCFCVGYASCEFLRLLLDFKTCIMDEGLCLAVNISWGWYQASKPPW